MGIYYRTEPCGCITAGTTYGPGSFVEKACGKRECQEIRDKAIQEASTKDEAEGLIDLQTRIPGLTRERLD